MTNLELQYTCSPVRPSGSDQGSDRGSQFCCPGCAGSCPNRGKPVKPDKKQRELMQSMSPGGVLELVLQQVFQRAYIEGLVIESFTVQQEIHQELSKHKEMPSLSTSAARNMNKLLSRMNWCRMMHFVKSNPGCEQSFLETRLMFRNLNYCAIGHSQDRYSQNSLVIARFPPCGYG